MKNFTRLFDIPYYQLEKYPQEDALAAKENNVWRKYSTAEVVKLINQTSLGLLKFGLKQGDTIAIIANNRPEWNIVDQAALQIGVIVVPIYPTISIEEFRFIFNDASVKVAFVSDKTLLDKVRSFKEDVPSLGKILTFDTIEGATNWDEIKKLGLNGPFDDVDKIKKNIDPKNVATIIYTSGTTGLPKGVMLSHNNIVSNIHSVMPVIPLNKDVRTLSFLPLCHIFERMVSYTYMATGCSIYYAQNMDTIGEDLKDVKPHFFTTVPRLLEKVYDKIMAKGEELTGIKKKLFYWAIDLGLEYDHKGKSPFYYAQLNIARKLVFSKWKEALGGEIKGICTGAAALQFRLEKIFNAAGIPVRQGYGLTETSPALCINRFDEINTKMGTVGMAVPDVTIKINPENGEILAKGDNIMMGYYNRPDATAEVIDADGWFHTGDVGELVDGKYLKITDRIKQLFKTSGGKYVAPQPIENKFVESTFIEQIMITGNDEKFVGALIVPSFEALKVYCKEKGIPNDSPETMIKQEAVKALYQSICDEYNPHFGKIEQVKRFKLLPKEWTIDGGELTPTLKVKRKKVLDKYAAEIAEIYNV
ncbi:MAG: long-chain fatty acid--CoA ligase [Chitinophagales bacterium]|nr:long-chain fatty acid--CoA ligase [Bacteroidota bacterium]MCB9043520.1 long-chain fatty acid--CoA ligase [Chitinophagales bacterium]